MVLTQWFERGRLEWHPDNPAGFRVVLGLLGTEARAGLVSGLKYVWPTILPAGWLVEQTPERSSGQSLAGFPSTGFPSGTTEHRCNNPRDWARPGAEAIATHVLERIGPGKVVLLHDGGGDRTQTLTALELILWRLHVQGYRFEPICT